MPPAIAAVVMALAVAVYGHGNLKRSVAAKDDCAYYSQACIDTARTCVNGNTGACGTYSASAVLPLLQLRFPATVSVVCTEKSWYSDTRWPRRDRRSMPSLAHVGVQVQCPRDL